MRKSLSDDQVRLIRNDPRSQRRIASDYDISQTQVSRIRNRTLYASVPDEGAPPQPDSYTPGVDAVRFLQSIPAGILSGVVTSPPYNRRQDGRPSAGHESMTKLTVAGYDDHDDAMPWHKYVKWQREFLTAALTAVGGEQGSGCVVYQHSRAIADRLEQRYDIEILDGFPVRQTIIWAKPGIVNQGGREPGFVGRSYEFVTLIAGRHWYLPMRWRSTPPINGGDLWRITPDRINPHPAPFPIDLATAMLMLCPDRGAVADPFAGSGTVGIAARRMGKAYYLGDLSTQYQAMFTERLALEA